MWTAGNFLDVQGSPDNIDKAMTQRMVFQHQLGTNAGVRSEVYFELNMAEVKIKNQVDTIYGTD